MFDIILSVVVLTAIALLAGAVYLWRTRGAVKQASLMAILAFVMIANALVWTVPDAGGSTLLENASDGPR